VSARRYDGTAVEYGGDPWLQWPTGEVIDPGPHVRAMGEGTCGDCHGGYFAPTGNGPTDYGIERCDACDRFDGDLAAAEALAAWLDGSAEVWVEVDDED